MLNFFKSIGNDIKYHGGDSFKRKISVFFFDLSFQLLLNYRLIRALNKTPFSFVSWFLFYFQKLFFSCEISPNAILGQKVRFAHPFGIVVGGDTIIEDNVTIFQQVTFGSHGKSDKIKGYPVVKEGAIIYTGAKIIGKIEIGKNVTVGANSVVLKSVPENCIAVGIPSKIISKNANE